MDEGMERKPDGGRVRGQGWKANSKSERYVSMENAISKIKPIETVYKGYRFRSRTEARWAVFFDACGLHYEYEHEGYVLPDGTYYLPDFWLPKREMFIEIKGSSPTQEELLKCRHLAELHECLCLAGTPGADYSGYYFAYERGDLNGDYDGMPSRFAKCRRCGGLTLVLLNFQPNGWAEETDFWFEVHADLSIGCKPGCRCDKWSCEEPQKELLIGRQQRFEHGESP